MSPADKTYILATVANAQQRAALTIILPLVMTTPNTQDAVTEWNQFKPLAAAFHAATSPMTALGNPVQFITWLYSQPNNAQGAKAYADHITSASKGKDAWTATVIAGQAVVREAVAAVNQVGFTVPGENIA